MTLHALGGTLFFTCLAGAIGLTSVRYGSTSSRLAMSLEISRPSSAMVDARGITQQWSRATRSQGTFSERYVRDDELYVVEGRAELRVSDFLGGARDTRAALYDDDDDDSDCGVRKVAQGDLVRAIDSCAVEWTVSEPLVLLSPPSELPVFAIVLVATVALSVGGLVLTAG